MQVTLIAALSINVPEFFARPDFRAWLNCPTSRRATWHTPGTTPPGEYADTFITFDNGEGSDFDDLFPADLHELLCGACAAHGISHGLLRLTNEAR